MWEFYLAASEMAFREQDLMVFQIQLTKRQDAVPMTRDYIVRDEAASARGRSATRAAAAARRRIDVRVAVKPSRATSRTWSTTKPTLSTR